MAVATSSSLLFLLLSVLLFVNGNSGLIYPLSCPTNITVKSCDSYLYHISRSGLSVDDIAKFYAVHTSEITPIKRQGNQDYLVLVPCNCGSVNGTIAYFYNTSYQVQPGDTLFNITNEIYSGQALTEGEVGLVPGEVIPMHLVCGCDTGKPAEVVVTYTVQGNDTVLLIACLLSSSVEEIVKLNQELSDPSFIDVGLVLFVPMADAAVPAASRESQSDEAPEEINSGDDQ